MDLLTIDIPKASEIDYSNHKEVYAYYHLWLMTVQCNGGLIYPSNVTRQLRDLESEGCVWLTGVKRIFREYLSPVGSDRETCGAYIPDLIDAYDMIYRISRGCTPRDYLREIRLKVIKKWLAGDKGLSMTAIALMIWSLIKNGGQSIDPAYTRFYFDAADRWIKELIMFGRFRDIPAIEAYQRLTHLIDLDLFAYASKEEAANMKNRWIKSHRVEDLTTLDTPTLRAYIAYVRTISSQALTCADGACSGVTCSDGESLINPLIRPLISELLTRSDLHPLDRRAYRLSLDHIAKINRAV